MVCAAVVPVEGEEVSFLIVTGLGRTGTTLTMQMLDALGVSLAPHNIGSYESDLADRLPRDQSLFSKDNCGKAMKVLDIRRFTPRPGDYRFISLRRDPVEQAKSEVKFVRELLGIQHPSIAALQRNNVSAQQQCEETIRQLASHRQDRVLELTFEQLLLDPHGSATSIKAFCDQWGFETTGTVEDAAACVISRPTECAPDLSIELSKVVEVTS